MRTSFLAGAILLAALTGAQAEPLAQIANGAIAGKADQGVEAFLGIPYAAPPLGDLRWRAPQPAPAWQGTLQATEFGHDCAQLPFASDAAPLGATPDEDCLYLNVWRPEGAESLPVMVWIHGGGFVNGGASAPVYDLSALAAQGIVAVSLNYRLGRLGTFLHPALEAGATPDEAGGNFGYLDQIAALKWVQDNIAAFGGNPDQVTLVGESAGGRSVHVMLTSPLAQGLVDAAVIQSGGDGQMMDASLDDARAAALTFARSKGIEGQGPEAAAALRALDADTVVDGLNLAALFMPDPSAPVDFTMPTLDHVVVVPTMAAYESGALRDIPVMIGATSADIGGPQGPMIAGALSYAQAMAEAGMKVWHYSYDYVAENARTNADEGAGHASEIPFFFGTIGARFGDAVTDTDRRASETALGYLADFVKAGNPNAPARPDWPQVGGGSLVFTPDGGASVSQ